MRRRIALSLALAAVTVIGCSEHPAAPVPSGDAALEGEALFKKGGTDRTYDVDGDGLVCSALFARVMPDGSTFLQCTDDKNDACKADFELMPVELVSCGRSEIPTKP